MSREIIDLDAIQADIYAAGVRARSVVDGEPTYGSSIIEIAWGIAGGLGVAFAAVLILFGVGP